jgi:hypothetical protein
MMAACQDKAGANRSAHTDTQQQVAALRRLLRSAGLQRYGAGNDRA